MAAARKPAEQYGTTTVRPPDFDAFWAGKLAALKQVPINPKLEPATTERDGVDLFTLFQWEQVDDGLGRSGVGPG